MAQFILSAFADEADRMLTGQIDALKQNGISLIELRGVNGKSVADLTDGETDEVRARLDDNGIKLSALGSPYGKYPIDQPFGPHRDAFRRGLELAHRLGTARMRMFSFYLPEDNRDLSAWRGKVVDQIGAMLDDAADASVLLCHENERGIYGESDTGCVDLYETFKGRLGCVYDPANYIVSGYDPFAAFEKVEKYITYMHIKDAVMATRAIVPTGKGDGRIGEILRRVASRKDDVILTVEPHLTVFDGLKDLQRETLKHEFVYPTPRAAFDAAVSALKETLAPIA